MLSIARANSLYLPAFFAENRNGMPLNKLGSLKIDERSGKRKQ